MVTHKQDVNVILDATVGDFTSFYLVPHIEDVAQDQPDDSNYITLVINDSARELSDL